MSLAQNGISVSVLFFKKNMKRENTKRPLMSLSSGCFLLEGSAVSRPLSFNQADPNYPRGTGLRHRAPRTEDHSLGPGSGQGVLGPSAWQGDSSSVRPQGNPEGHGVTAGSYGRNWTAGSSDIIC